eukprot:TRINITY_DN15450_c0_g1_i1.p1 TRINITY_DN15450_c0_g1~~TRINITY_DN15450_c0_g1_i1.p1  ORF type:complete len:125 (-),score=29.35 TRINITY_DN15450_c0_g1_i1:10-384(-)
MCIRDSPTGCYLADSKMVVLSQVKLSAVKSDNREKSVLLETENVTSLTMEECQFRGEKSQLVRGVNIMITEKLSITSTNFKFLRRTALRIVDVNFAEITESRICLLYTSPSPRDGLLSRMPSSA